MFVSMGELSRNTSLPLQSKTSQPSSLGHRGDKQPQDALQGGQSSSQSHGVEGGEKAVQASPSTEAGGCG